MEMTDVKEAAKILGVSHSTINGWMFRKCLPFPFYKIHARCIRFNKSDVIKYLERTKTNG